jgi:hypothetical protein
LSARTFSHPKHHHVLVPLADSFNHAALAPTTFHFDDVTGEWTAQVSCRKCTLLEGKEIFLDYGYAHVPCVVRCPVGHKALPCC